MKVKLQIALIILAASVSIFAQRGRIVTEALTPHRLETLGMTTNISSGLNVVPKDAYIYMSAENIGNTDGIITATYVIVTKPAGSATVLETVNNRLWMQFKPDVTGAYTVKLTITTVTGSHDTTQTYYVSNFVGVGNFAGVTAEYPNCMTCHQNTDKFVDIFNRWEKSGHATAFKEKVSQGTGSHFTSNCISCHVTGYIPNSENGGFDDIASQLGWVLGTPNAGKFDSLKTYFTALTNMATIGCEACHGPGSEHTQGPHKEEIAISIKAGTCGQCHDEPWRHNKFAQYENSLHAEALWSNSFAQATASQNNNLQNCIRCHDGNAFINFTKGKTTNTTGMTVASHESITCATCHDPHGNDNVAQLRFTPTGSDTLANGFKYNDNYTLGTGELCVNCHKSRRDNVLYTKTLPTSTTWGPHHSVQADVLLGQNAAEFGEPFLTSPHKWAVENTCVGCHMTETVDTSDHANRDKVGGHTFSLHNAETGLDLTTNCTKCHGEKDSFDEFISKLDYDGNGKTESISKEIDGLLKNLSMALPPKNVDLIDYKLFKNDKDSLLYTKAYFNYQLIANDGSKGMHNAVYAIDVLRKSTKAIGGFVTGVELEENPNYTPTGYALSQNYPNPFNPSTTIMYAIPFESNVTVKVYNITGQLVRELVNATQSSGTYNIKFNLTQGDSKLSSGIYFYSIEAKSLEGNKSFRQTKKMVLMK